MNEQELRSTVKRLYPLSTKWAARVDKMPIAQVYKIHLRQSKLEDYERELAEKKTEMRNALLEETAKTDEPRLQGTLF